MLLFNQLSACRQMFAYRCWVDVGRRVSSCPPAPVSSVRSGNSQRPLSLTPEVRPLTTRPFIYFIFFTLNCGFQRPLLVACHMGLTPEAMYARMGCGSALVPVLNLPGGLLNGRSIDPFTDDQIRERKHLPPRSRRCFSVHRYR